MRSFLKIFLLPMVLSCGDSGKTKTRDTEPSDEVPSISNKATITDKSTLECSDGTSLSYLNFGKGFLLTYCTSCHSRDVAQNENFITLDRYEDVSKVRIQILESVINTPTMPPDNAVLESEKSELNEWLNCGAPEG